MATTIYLMRHGQSRHNAAFENGATSIREGELGSKLTELGKEQARQAAEQLAETHFDAIYSSDYHRAHQTAKIIAKPRKMTPTAIRELRERSWGSLQRKNFDPVIKQVEQLQANLSELEKMKVKLTDDMESEWDGAMRVKTKLEELADLHRDQQILVVNHGNIMRSFLTLIGFATYTQLASGTVANCGYAVLLRPEPENWQVQTVNGIQLLAPV